MQWIAITITAAGVMCSAYYNSETLRSARIENELSSYLNLNERYQKLIFSLISGDADIFQIVDFKDLHEKKYIIYELLELFSTVKALEGYYLDLDKNIWPIWDERIKFLFSKPAVQSVWKHRRIYAEKIYKAEFIQYVEQVFASKSDSSGEGIITNSGGEIDG